MNREPTHWIEIDRSALLGNLDFLRSCLADGVEIACVVKSNAYGHGLEQVLRVLEPHCEWLAVHAVAEARAIRRLGVSSPRILVMGSFCESELTGLDERIHVFVSTIGDLEIIAERRALDGFQLGLHVKADTGTNRQGFRREEVAKVFDHCRRLNLRIDGLATHFANIEDTLEPEFARLQIDRFTGLSESLQGEGFARPKWLHSACSAAVLLVPEAAFDLVRPGISLYGFWPSRETRLAWILANGRPGHEPLRPVIAWKARIGQIKSVPRGETVGYGRSWQAGRDSVIAVLPVGYADGFPRAMGNRGRVLIQGCSAPIVGRICMNIMMVDVTDIAETSVGDPVTLLGRDGDGSIEAEEIAEICGTIHYEIVARLSPAIPRRVVDSPAP